jgi:NTE family protein
VERALVLGGGGVTGIWWELGVLRGLRDGGVDLTAADLIVGTSAGSFVGALIATGVDLVDVAASRRASEAAPAAPELDPGQMVAAIVALRKKGGTPQELRARIGEMALTSSRVSETERLGVIASRLPSHQWPERKLLITAVDAGDGRFVVWDRDSGVPLVQAVAASCAVPGVWPPVGIDGRRYMDGGVRSINNSDLAAGYDPVAILAPYTLGLEGSLEDEVVALGDASVVIVSPDREALEAIGPNPLDPGRRAEALEAGLAQAARELDRAGKAWMGSRD